MTLHRRIVTIILCYNFQANLLGFSCLYLLDMQSPLSESSAVKYRPLYGTEENDRPRETYWYSSKLLSQLLVIVSAIANLLLLGLLVWRNSSANTAGGLLRNAPLLRLTGWRMLNGEIQCLQEPSSKSGNTI